MSRLYVEMDRSGRLFYCSSSITIWEEHGLIYPAIHSLRINSQFSQCRSSGVLEWPTCAGIITPCWQWTSVRMQCKLIWPVEDCILSNESIETKRNESKPTPFDSTQILSKRNPSNRKESNRNRLLSIRHYRRNPWVDSITFDSFRFDRLASIDSAISALSSSCRSSDADAGI